ncbi:MAG: hypothetical protein V1834_00285 [Candidatus Micrarchaeota archaeon]
MSRVSKKTFDKVAESVLGVLYDNYPGSVSTRFVAGEVARDKEFVAKVLDFLRGKGFVEQWTKSRAGEEYERWAKWRLSKRAYDKYAELT